MPPWSIVTGRVWKSQVPTFARHHRVVVYDPRGNGASDRPPEAASYSERAMADDLLAIMDAADVERAILISLSLGAQRALIAGDERPDRVLGQVFIAPAVPLADDPTPRPGRAPATRAQRLRRVPCRVLRPVLHGGPLDEADRGRASAGASRPTATALLVTTAGPRLDADEVRAMGARIACPVLIIQGTDDAITGVDRGRALAEAIPGARLELIEGGGHLPNARDPIRIDLLIRAFVREMPGGSAR